MYPKFILTILLTSLLVITTFSQATEFTYQGNLKDGPNVANGNYDFEFRLFDALSGGSQDGPVVTKTNISVTNGKLGIALEFGGSFPGAERYL